MRIYVLAAAILLSAPAVAGDFNWHAKTEQTKIIGALANMARFCSDFGFLQRPKQPDDVLHGKLEAYLLLSPSADYVLQRWANMLH